VLFGEYILYCFFFCWFSDKVDFVWCDFVFGCVPGVLRFGLVIVGVVICFEVVYDDFVCDIVCGGVDLLVV